MRVSVVGLGKLGASMVGAIASRGIPAIGIDINPDTVEKVNRGIAPVDETNLQLFFDNHKLRISATDDYDFAIRESDITFVVVNTPSDDEGSFSLRYAKPACRSIGEALKNKNEYHLVVITSTVLPGSTRYGLLPEIEQASGKKAGVDFGLCYNPEFIALGSVIKDFLNPDMLLIGHFDTKSKQTLMNFYNELFNFKMKGIGKSLLDITVNSMSIENAELTKIALNTYITTKITFANMIADLCEIIPHGDADVVLSAIGSDSRVGGKYLKGGLGYGGPCFPRDNVALQWFAGKMGKRVPIANIVHRFNADIPFQMSYFITVRLNIADKIAVLGISYKPFSPVVEESQGLALVEKLMTKGYKVVGMDPMDVGVPGIKKFDVGALKDFNVIIVANPDPAFAKISDGDIEDGTRVFDFWRLANLSKMKHINYIPYGKAKSHEFNEHTIRKLWE